MLVYSATVASSNSQSDLCIRAVRLLYFLMCTARNNLIVENVDFEILTDLYVFSIPEHKELVFGMLFVGLIIRMSVPMCALLTPV
jgi:hypothetical protein